VLYSSKKIGFIALAFFTVLITASYAASPIEKSIPDIKAPVRVAIIPFEPLLPDKGEGTSAACPICNISYPGGRIEKGAENIVEEVFIDKLKEDKEIEIIPLEKVEAIYKLVAVESLKNTMLGVIKKVGRDVGADVVVIGHVYRYMERVGYGYSVEKPASVAYEIHLIRVSDGSPIWRGVFDKTQKSLMEDVFQISSFYKGHGKWLTARQLAKQGMDTIFHTFPDF
jgi:hypothetical protein